MTHLCCIVALLSKTRDDIQVGTCMVRLQFMRLLYRPGICTCMTGNSKRQEMLTLHEFLFHRVHNIISVGIMSSLISIINLVNNNYDIRGHEHQENREHYRK